MLMRARGAWESERNCPAQEREHHCELTHRRRKNLGGRFGDSDLASNQDLLEEAGRSVEDCSQDHFLEGDKKAMFVVPTRRRDELC